MRLIDLVLGAPLATAEAEENKVNVSKGIPLLGLDALSSAAYGPEAAMTILLPMGVMGLTYVLPIVGIIVALLAILYFSYRQTIHAYPNGGGSYIVASANLGKLPGLFAAAALMLDYILTVSVGISAGVGALISAVPELHRHILLLCLLILVLITLVNLRGVRDAGVAFFVPTYLFCVSLLGVLAYGVLRTFLEGGHPKALVTPAAIPAATAAVAPWLLMRAFSSGCTAMTGVEAVSNGIQAFEQPRTERAQGTLSSIVAILALMLVGIAYLCRIYHVGATDPDASTYQSVLSQLVSAIAGRGAIYYITIFSVIAVLALSANTGFSDFPRLCHLVADDNFLPHFFTIRGRRLVYSSGILILAALCGGLLIAFKGITDRLIPLYAIGAFLAFTLSQAGMVIHWRRHHDKGWKTSLAINLLGAVCTGIALAVVLVAKFVEGAWITVLLIPIVVLVFLRVEHHYEQVQREVVSDRPLSLPAEKPPVVLIPLKDWDLVGQNALQFALSLTNEIVVLHVDSDDDPDAEQSDHLHEIWQTLVVQPLKAAGRPAPELRRVASPFRRFIQPVLREVREMTESHPGRRVIVVVPEIVVRNVTHWPLHNQRATMLKAAILLSGQPNIVVANVPWYLDDAPDGQ